MTNLLTNDKMGVKIDTDKTYQHITASQLGEYDSYKLYSETKRGMVKAFENLQSRFNDNTTIFEVARILRENKIKCSVY